MNRRGFLRALGAGVAAIALEARLQAAMPVLPAGDADGWIFNEYNVEQLARSMLETKERAATEVLSSSYSRFAHAYVEQLSRGS